jgi:hypothetical protein
VPAERTLTTRSLNRALLARQFLLERSSLSLVATIERIGGLQTQYAPSGYIGLWSRLNNLPRDALTAALNRRMIIQGTLLRSTIHMVSARDYWLFLAATRSSRQEWFRRITAKQHGELDMEGAARILRKALANGPGRQSELRAMLVDKGVPAIAWGGLSAWLHMVRVPPSGTWDQRRADLYELAERWVKPVEHIEAAGLRHVVTRYLGGFGPASVRDIADWAGIPLSKLVPIVAEMRLVRFRDEQGKELIDLPGGSLPDPATPAPIRFLPTWDATLLVHARRTQILPERFRPLVFNTRTPHSKPTFLVDGQVAGTWRDHGGHITLEPFEPLGPKQKRQLEDETKRLQSFMA